MNIPTFVKYLRCHLAFAILCFTLILSCNQNDNKAKDNYSNKSIKIDTVNTSQKFPFEKIEYGSYDINSFRTKQKNRVYIDLYSIIDKSGLVTIRNEDKQDDSLKFYTYQLSAVQLAKLNLVFSKKEHVKDNILTLKDDSGYYMGSYDFVIVTRQNKLKDSLSFVNYQMSDEFREVYDMLNSVYYFFPGTKPTKRFEIPQYFKNAIYTSYKNSPYLPKIETIPSFRPEDQ